MTVMRRTLLSGIAAVMLGLAFQACSDDPAGPPPQMFDNPSTIIVRNRVLGPILFFHVRTCGTTQWSEDLLPLDPIEGTIQPGADKEFTVEAGCYDLWARHLETTEPGPPIEKMIFDQQATPVSPLIWTVEEMGPS